LGDETLRVLMAMCALLAATSLAWAAADTPTTTPTTPASTANQVLPPDPALPYSWAGFYIRDSTDLSLGSQATGTDPFGGLFSASSTGVAGSTGSLDSGEIGANWQNGHAVVGFESDMQWSDQWAAPLTACGLGCSLNDRVKVPWLATLRARAGTAFDRMYIYGTGGFATSGSADSLNPTASGGAPNFVDLSAGDLDWTIGGGMEFAIDQNVSAKIEYLHTSPAGGAPESLFDAATTGSVRDDILRGGFNYSLPIGQ
jgi:outer membrane immunogenic protein